MMTYDFSPLLRNAIGFDRLMHLVDNVAQQSSAVYSGYPPYNIEKVDETEYRLTMAVAGFGPDDISVEVEGNHLTIAGKLSSSPKNSQILHRGIAARAFERSFTLADHVEIETAELNNGLLSIGLKQIIPEALKPRKIPVVLGAVPGKDVLPEKAKTLEESQTDALVSSDTSANTSLQTDTGAAHTSHVSENTVH